MNVPEVAEAPMGWDALPGLFPDFAEPDRWIAILRQHAALLAEAAPRVRVTSTPPGEWVRRHYAESLELLGIALGHSRCESLADVGSGGGFPGLVVAAVRPDCEVHLVEPLRKRARLLEEIAAALGLTNVTVHAQRAEEAGRGALRDRCAVVTARAVAPLAELLEYTSPLTRPGGLLVLAKGSGAEAELGEAAAAARALGCSFRGLVAMRPEISSTVSVALFEKAGATPEQYPRRPGAPRKRPISAKS